MFTMIPLTLGGANVSPIGDDVLRIIFPAAKFGSQFSKTLASRFYPKVKHIWFP